ncbi:MAG TPA: lytic transglycosylase domain-containing protein [Terriglobales bacterium]|nr:lytic transglycosylase domain-containing protein [Terriglobales bacterium]
MTRSLLAAALTVAALAAAAPVAAQTHQFVGPDGTVHYTNAPTDPRYRRMVSVSGTEQGWLKLPAAVTATPSFNDIIRGAAQRYGVPEELVAAVIRVESGFNAKAVSRKGARGLMQLMPGTAAILGVRDSFDPTENIEGGVRHLRALMDRFGNNLPLALAAYNAGAGAVDNYGGIPPYPETQQYVGRILSIIGGPALPGVSDSTFRYVEDDGAVVYTNIPPRGIVRAKRK